MSYATVVKQKNHKRGATVYSTKREQDCRIFYAVIGILIFSCAIVILFIKWLGLLD